MAPRLYERTNGQVEILITSFPELGIAGPDVLTLVADGTLTMAQVYSGYIAGELPAIEIVTLWGVYPDNEITYRSQVTLLEDLEQLVLDETGGVVINHNWFSGVEQYFFCKERIDTLEDFRGKKTRSHSAALSDWINGMGAEGAVSWPSPRCTLPWSAASWTAELPAQTRPTASGGTR